MIFSLFSIYIVPVHALTATELDKFSVDASITTNQGTSGGVTLTPSLTVSSSGSSHTFAGNMVPPHATGSSYTMPITTYISAQNSNIEVPSSPVEASSTTCLPSGTLGVAVNGVAIFSAYSRPCTDAIADEAIGFDSCDGHPQEQGTYHYHYKSDCLQVKSASSGGDSTIVTSAGNQQLYGVALDGFPIYNKWDANGDTIANSQLDTCHGYDAGDGIGYRYIVNDEFPYIIGCFVGTPLTTISCHCSSTDAAMHEYSCNIGVGVLLLSAVFAWVLEM